MNTIQVTRTPKKELVKKAVRASDGTKVLKGEGRVVEEGTGRTVALLSKLDDINDLAWALKTLTFQTGERTLGLKSTSRIFGYRPRITIRQDYCSAASMAKDHPEQHDVLIKYAQKLAKLYQRLDPEFYGQHYDKVAQEVLDEWRIPETPFTSGICNKNNQLKYHYDAGNFKGVRSVMIVATKGMKGGELVLPEYDCKVEFENGSLIIFDGASELHGVAPISLVNKNGYRFSVVYYSLLQMRHCLPCDEELKRIRNVKRNRENKRAEGRAGQ